MSTHITCIPVTADGQVGHSWSKAATVAVTTVLAGHMGEPMQHMLAKLGVQVRLGVEGDARAAVTSF